jgi:hypothetical protein
MRIWALTALLALLGLSGTTLADSCDPEGRPPWLDSRVAGDRPAIVREALRGIQEHIDVSAVVGEVEIGYELDDANCSMGADGCFVREERVHTTTQCLPTETCELVGYEPVWDPWLGTYRCIPVYGRVRRLEPATARWKAYDKQISITSCGFDRGWRNLDPAGSVLWDTSYSRPAPSDRDHLYYRFAQDVVESVQATLLHEISHARGNNSCAVADEYARQMILELRKAKKGLYAKFYLPPLGATDESATTAHLACMARGSAPSVDDLPPGSARW